MTTMTEIKTEITKAPISGRIAKLASTEDPQRWLSVWDSLNQDSLQLVWESKDYLPTGKSDTFVSNEWMTKQCSPMLSTSLLTSLPLSQSQTQHTCYVFAEGFFVQFCEHLERRKKSSTLRIGYEVLRWAMLSTTLSIACHAHILYRSLLQPLNAGSIYSLLKGLLGSLQYWNQTNCYLDEEQKQEISDLYGQEACLFLETLDAAAQELFAQECEGGQEGGRLQEHPSIFWTAVALLRCDKDIIYNRALALLRTCLGHSQSTGYPYLFQPSITHDDNIFQSFQSHDGSYSSHDESHNVAERSYGSVNGPPKCNASPVPDNFFNFSEQWQEPFLGIQPYLFKGVLSSISEPTAIDVMTRLILVVLDAIVDPSQTRHLSTILTFLPWLYGQMKYHQKESSARRTAVLQALVAVIGPFSIPLQEIFMTIQSGIDLDKFLSNVCGELVKAYFPQYIPKCTEFLHAMLESPMEKYKPIALRITTALLSQSQNFAPHNPIHYIKHFVEIIDLAQQIITEKSNLNQMPTPSPSLIQLPSTSTSTSWRRFLPSSKKTIKDFRYEQSKNNTLNKTNNFFSNEFTSAASSLIAVVITIFNDTDERIRKTSLLPIEESVHTESVHTESSSTHSKSMSQDLSQVQVLPKHSLNSAVQALEKVLRHTPCWRT